jgi:hypothetical protein
MCLYVKALTAMLDGQLNPVLGGHGNGIPTRPILAMNTIVNYERLQKPRGIRFRKCTSKAFLSRIHEDN